MIKKKKLLVLFKTHLDIGFTDFSENVVEHYLKYDIPKALCLARKLRGKQERFIWIVGSWLISKYLEQATAAERREMEDAIENGDIRWHGLPFTTHTEIMDKGLFEYGLSLSHDLDNKFNMKTTAAKMTDVPGHTKAMIPLLSKAGVRLLHIGVNTASTVPNVPPVFRWVNGDSDIIVIYSKAYGGYSEIPGTDTAVYFAHTDDNIGPQSLEQIEELYEKLHLQFPDMEITAANMEDVAEAVIPFAKEFPVISSEIGDTWIHGTGSDPKKVSEYRHLLRTASACAEKGNFEQANKIYKHLILVPEHTWGLDEKTHLGTFAENQKGEYQYFIKKEFESARSAKAFRKMEASWKEQRQYVKDAEAELSFELKSQLEEQRQGNNWLELSEWQEIDNISETIYVGDYEIRIGENGQIISMKCSGKVLADAKHEWGKVIYEVFSAQDYQRFVSQYITCKEEWAIEDFTKIGVDKAVNQHVCISPEVKHIYRKNNKIAVHMEILKEASEKYGAPQKYVLIIELLKQKVKLKLQWKEKSATRCPEALWLCFNFLDSGLQVRKLSQWINPYDVVEKGNRHIHATDLGARYNDISIESLDGALICIGKPSLLDFTDKYPQKDEGISFNLYNNVWGTNFVMWYEDDASFRYDISWK